MMEVVQLVEVSGQGEHQVMENFEDLILTVVPEGQEGTALHATGSNDGQQRTIVVHEVRNNQEGEDKTEVIENLQGRVHQLEEQVHFLEDELRIMRRKMLGNPTSNYSAIRRTVLEVLSKQTIKCSVSDFEDETDSQEPVGSVRQGQKRRKYENGFSDDDEDDDFSEEEQEQEPVRKRRGPGRPPKNKYGFTKKPKTHRVELTPPPPKISRPRGRPRRTELKQEPEDTPGIETVDQSMDIPRSTVKEDSADEEVTNTTSVIITGDVTVEENEENSFVAENDGENETEEGGESEETAVPQKTKLKTEIDATEGKDSKATQDEAKMSPKRGRRRAATEEKDPEPAPIPTAAPVRVSTRARKVSRKGSD